MKKQISKKDLANYIQEQVQNLYKLHTLNEEKTRIENDLKVLNENKYTKKASEFIGKEISHLQKDKGYKHDRAVAAALNVAKDKGYKVPAPTNEIENNNKSADSKKIAKQSYKNIPTVDNIIEFYSKNDELVDSVGYKELSNFFEKIGSKYEKNLNYIDGSSCKITIENIHDNGSEFYVKWDFTQEDGSKFTDKKILKSIKIYDMFPETPDFSYSEEMYEIDKSAMDIAKKDIKNDGQRFDPLGKNNFEDGINKKSLYKAMSPEKKLNEGLTEKGMATVQRWIEEGGARGAAVKMVDQMINKMIGLSSSDLGDTAIYANGLDSIEDLLENGEFDAALSAAKETAQEMITDEGGGDMFGGD